MSAAGRLDPAERRPRKNLPMDRERDAHPCPCLRTFYAGAPLTGNSPPGRFQMSEPLSERQILGVNFYVGDVQGAIRRVSRGGLLVVPAAPALKDVAWNDDYREALRNADVAIADSAFMVIVWNFLQSDSIPRLSGLRYLKELLQLHEVRMPGNTFWVMAGSASSRKNMQWLHSQGIDVPPEFVYKAP